MQYDSISETELISAARSGDRESFNALVLRCAAPIYNLALRLTGNEQDARDLSQDAFVNAFKYIHDFEGKSSFSSWVYRITVNLWKNRVKHEKSRAFFRHFSLDRLLETYDDELRLQVAGPDPDPAASSEENSEAMLMQKSLGALEANDRLMIVLRDVEGKSYEEIATALERPLGTVKSRIARAREALRKEWLKRHEL